MKVSSKAFLLLYVISVFSISWVFYGRNARSETIVVGPGSSIQAAIDNANEGDTVLVKPGTYFERLTISKPIAVIGSDGSPQTLLESPGGGHTVEISWGTTNVVFAGFTLKGTSSSTWSGIYVGHNLNNTIRDNVIVNHEYGIHIYDSTGNILRNNNMSNNKYNLRVWGLFLSHFLHDIDSSNSVDGKPVYYWVNQRDKTVPRDAGFLALVNSANIVVRDLNLSNSSPGVLLAYTSHSIVTGVTVFNNEHGLYLVSSNCNILVNNNLFNNSWAGISTVSSSGNLIIGNAVRRNLVNLGSGIRLSHSFNLLGYYSEDNLISGNIVENNVDGIYLEASPNNRVSGNKVTNNTRYGIVLDGSSQNTFWKNALADNKHCVWINTLERTSRDNVFYRNDFAEAVNSVIINSSFSSANRWHMDYPVGGNFWGSDIGVDLFTGPNQDQLGSDGIIDTPYTIDEQNKDQYPLLASPPENCVPTAEFSYYPQTPKRGENVTFVNEAFDQDGVIIWGFWDFGDSLYDARSNISRSFDEVKNYLVKLTVFDDEGAMDAATTEVIVRKYLSVLYLSIPSEAILGDPIILSATLWDSDNEAPLADALVNFFLDDVNERIQIGLSVTNTSGIAAISYTPLRTGTLRIRAAFEGSLIHDNASATQDLVVTESHSFWLEGLLVLFVLATLALGFLRWKITRNRRK